MLSGVDERIEKVPRHVCLAFNNGIISDIAASRFRVRLRPSGLSARSLFIPQYQTLDGAGRATALGEKKNCQVGRFARKAQHDTGSTLNASSWLIA